MPIRHRVSRTTLALLTLLPLACRTAQGDAAAQQPAGEPETHVLFTGTEVRIQHGGKLHPVRDVEGSSLVIKVNDRDKGLGIPIAGNAGKLVVTRVQTLADRTATITGYAHERTYTAANDPYRKAAEGMLNAVSMSSRASELEARLRAEPEKISVFRGGSAPETADNPLRQEIQQDLEMVQKATSGTMGTPGYYADRMAQEQAQQLFDALEVRFQVASAQPLHDAYVIIVARYHTKDDPKSPQDWLVARALGAIGAEPRKVSVLEGGLPPGYVLEKVNVHLYEQGVEVATDLSENRAPLTRSEAHEYLVIEHVSMHPDKTMPAQVALTRLPTGWTSRPRDAAFRKAYFVRVDKDGRPTGVFEDAAGQTRTDSAESERVLMDLLFLPALDKGDPVESLVKVKLSDLSA